MIIRPAIFVSVHAEGCALDICAHPCLSDARKEKIARLTTVNGKIQSALAEIALLLCLKYAKKPFKQAHYEYGYNGKPFLLNPDDGFISLSHAGLTGACAWSEKPIGIDIEMENRDVDKIRKRVVSAADDENISLISLWCIKESYVKMTGEGLSRPFTTLSAAGGRVNDQEGAELARYASFSKHNCCMAVCARGDVQMQMHHLLVSDALRELEA